MTSTKRSLKARGSRTDRSRDRDAVDDVTERAPGRASDGAPEPGTKALPGAHRVAAKDAPTQPELEAAPATEATAKHVAKKPALRTLKSWPFAEADALERLPPPHGVIMSDPRAGRYSYVSPRRRR